MRKRTEVIREWIDARKERGGITKCMFYKIGRAHV